MGFVFSRSSGVGQSASNESKSVGHPERSRREACLPTPNGLTPLPAYDVIDSDLANAPKPFNSTRHCDSDVVLIAQASEEAISY